MRNILLLITVGFLISCEGFFKSDIDIGLPAHQSRLVLNSLITPSDSLRILLTKSQGILSNDPVDIYVPDAQIRVVRNGDAVDGAFFVNSQFHYISPVIFPAAGDEFEITVSVAGFPEASAIAVVPQPAALYSAQEIGKKVVFDGGDRKIIRFEMEDLSGQNNYYEVVIAQVTEEEAYKRVGYDDFFFQTSISWQEITLHGVAFSDAAVSGKTSVEIEAFQQAYYGDSSYFLELRTVTYDYYAYATTIAAHMENQQQELFSGEPVPMHSNVEGGYGIVGAYNAVQTELELTKDF